VVLGLTRLVTVLPLLRCQPSRASASATSEQVLVGRQPRVIQPYFGRPVVGCPCHILREGARAAAHAAHHGEVGGQDRAPSTPLAAKGVSRAGPPAQGTTTPSATVRMCPGSTPAFAPQWYEDGSAWRRIWKPFLETERE